MSQTVYRQQTRSLFLTTTIDYYRLRVVIRLARHATQQLKTPDLSSDLVCKNASKQRALTHERIAETSADTDDHWRNDDNALQMMINGRRESGHFVELVGTLCCQPAKYELALVVGLLNVEGSKQVILIEVCARLSIHRRASERAIERTSKGPKLASQRAQPDQVACSKVTALVRLFQRANSVAICRIGAGKLDLIMSIIRGLARAARRPLIPRKA